MGFDEREEAKRKLIDIDRLFNGRHFDREVIVLCVRWYHRRLDDEWFVQATGLYVRPDGEAIDETRYRFMHLSLNGHGTQHDFTTFAALEKHLAAAIKEMEAVAAHPARIHCPKCKVRMVRVR